ncbi:recombinase family protein [Candidatus Fukatsuia endosymbiont of Drepanosiphum platanoidis]|uniref:recombinase family protein n=1 Tax=Candidatus Fukatsuia endosymbiont of Drepanosiphum platanoidis TaxID=3077953 RepID=UPI00196853DA
MNKALVALYARVSSGQQVKNGTIGSQLAAIKDRIREDGHVLPDAMLFIDDGVSGATLIRPQLERLRDYAAAGDIECLYILSPDRLARKYAYQALLMEEFSACGVEVIFICHTPGDTPEDMMLLQMQGMFAEYERAKIMERNRRGKLHGARCGNVGVLSGAPYGYRYIRRQPDGTPAQYIVNLHEASVVRKIFSWAGIERLSLGGVVRRLAEKGIESATGKPGWDRSTVWGMLKNPAYKGLAVFGKTKNCAPRPRVRAARNSADILKNGYSVIRSKPDDGIGIPVPAIINSALFLTVNEQLEENRRHARQGRRGAAYLLQGLTVCGHCRYAYYGKKVSKSAAKGGAQYSYYHCTGTDAYRFGGIRVCDNKQVRTSMLDETVWAQVIALLSEPERLKKEYEQRLTQASEHSGQTADAERLKKQENQLNVGRSRLIDSFAEGLIGKTDFEPRIRVMTLRLAELARQRVKVKQATENQHELLLLVNRVEDFAAAVTERLSTDDFLMKREILRALVKRIEIYRDEIVVVFRVNPGNDTSLEAGSDKTYGRSLPDCLRSNHSPLRRTGRLLPDFHLFHRSSFKPHLDQLYNRAINDSGSNGQQ